MARRRALAVFGLAYSLGTSIAAFLAALDGVPWRGVFVGTAVLGAGLALAIPLVCVGAAERVRHGHHDLNPGKS